MLIEHMHRERIGLGYAVGASQLALRATAWNRVKGLADGVGSSSGPWVGYIASADCAFDTSGEQTSIRRSFRLRARSSVGGMSNGFVRRSNPASGWSTNKLALFALAEPVIHAARRSSLESYELIGLGKSIRWFAVS
jgi:hypothetical protein